MGSAPRAPRAHQAAMSQAQLPFISGVVLAAGLSSRLRTERPKQLLPFEGEPLVRRTARCALASALQEVIVVLGWKAEAVGRALDGLPLQTVENPHFACGQSTSVKAGLEALSPDAEAALFLPIDQPYLSSSILDRLIHTYHRTGGPIVLPTFRGRCGAPVLFSRTLFPELKEITGDEGGRQLLKDHPGEIVTLELDDETPLLDVNTPQDRAALERSG